jgi:anti-sigma B factor antagonist
MSLEITIKEHEGIQILDLNGHLTFGQEDLDFRGELDRLVKAGRLRVALNLGGLRKLDTTGLGTLLFALAKLRKAGGSLAIFNIKPAHIELLTEAELETAFEVFLDEQGAIAALSRIHHGSFGTCIECESAISPKRLAAVPWAPRCPRLRATQMRHLKPATR